MEIAKDKIGIGYNSDMRENRKRERRGFLDNKTLFITIILTTLVFSIMNIMLIVNFFKILSNF